MVAIGRCALCLKRCSFPWLVSTHHSSNIHHCNSASHSAAANATGLPSVLITNFTFDSVFSYLSTSLVDGTVANQTSSPLTAQPLPPDVAIPMSELAPLVEEVWEGYRCADLLLRLPGAIPIPSFFASPMLPSTEWVDPGTKAFTPEVIAHLLENPSKHTLLPQIPFPREYPPKGVPRLVLNAPLLVRPPHPAIYTAEGRNHLLETIGVPARTRHARDTKILIVSFGGQVFHMPQTPSRSHSRSSSYPVTPHGHPVLAPSNAPNVAGNSNGDVKAVVPIDVRKGVEALSQALQENLATPPRRIGDTPSQIIVHGSRSQPILNVPGAPPANIPSSPTGSTIPTFPTFSSMVIPPTPQLEHTTFLSSSTECMLEDGATALPDETWIAIVCGVPKGWTSEDGNELPENFFVAPKDVYMPDLTAVADVLLGKLVSVVHICCV